MCRQSFKVLEKTSSKLVESQPFFFFMTQRKFLFASVIVSGAILQRWKKPCQNLTTKAKTSDT